MNRNNAHFAVKRKSNNPKVPPVLVAFVESYDDAIIQAERRNERCVDKPYYPTVHTA